MSADYKDIRSPLEVVLQTEDFLVMRNYVDLPQGRMHLVHITIYRWSARVLRDLRDAYKKYRPHFPPLVFAQPNEDTPLFERFVARFGFRPINDCVCTDGQNRRIFVNKDGTIVQYN